MNFRAEFSPSNRATCRECRKLINQGEKRIVETFQRHGHSADIKFHIECFKKYVKRELAELGLKVWFDII